MYITIVSIPDNTILLQFLEFYNTFCASVQFHVYIPVLLNHFTNNTVGATQEDEWF